MPIAAGRPGRGGSCALRWRARCVVVAPRVCIHGGNANAKGRAILILCLQLVGGAGLVARGGGEIPSRGCVGRVTILWRRRHCQQGWCEGGCRAICISDKVPRGSGGRGGGSASPPHRRKIVSCFARGESSIGVMGRSIVWDPSRWTLLGAPGSGIVRGPHRRVAGCASIPPFCVALSDTQLSAAT